MSGLDIKLFGPMLVSVNGEPLPRMRSRKAKWVLAILTLRRGQPVGRDWVAGMLWPDTDQEVGRANLRPLVSELRGAIGAEQGRLKTPDRRTLRLDLDGLTVDLFAFDDAIKAGELETAIELYAGALLEDCPEEWVVQERDRREQAVLEALAKLGRAKLPESPVEAAALARRAIAVSPWRDGPRRDLMEALAESGDLNAALQSYRDFAQWLRSERGDNPDAKTTELYLRLRSDSGRQSGQTEAARRSPGVTGYLPHPLTTLIGREDEQADVRDRLRRHRLVTLIGPGGIGKTRLAREIAASSISDFPDGVSLVSLESVTEGRLVLGHLAQALGMREGLGQSLGNLLIEKLRPKRLLIVLDNCEHVLRDVAAIVQEILAHCGEVKILATSREAIGILGERAWPVPALSSPDPAQMPPHLATRLRVAMAYESVLLFAERAEAAHKKFHLTAENVDSVIKVCEQLQGVPLALELAAARTKSMPVHVIAERLESHRLALLVHPQHGAGSRRQTLRGTLDWSHALLSPPEQTLLRRLSVFSGGWTLEAAESVCAGAPIDREWVIEGLGHLVDKSLVAFDSETAEGRYSMLDTVRQYAKENLAEAGETESVGRRHREWYLSLAKRAQPELMGLDQSRWLRSLAREMGNLRTALDGYKDDPATALQICNALFRFWYRQGCFEEGRLSIVRALGRYVEIEIPVLSDALGNVSTLAILQGDYEAAQKWLQEASRLPPEIVGKKGVGRYLVQQGVLHLYLGRNAEAKSFYEQSVEVGLELGDPHMIAGGACNLGVLAAQVGEFEESKRRCAEALGYYRETSDRHPVAFALNALGNAHCATGDYLAARSFFEESVAIFEELGDRDAVANNMYGLGNLDFALGNYEAAKRWYEECQREFKSVGNFPGTANALWGIGLAYLGLAENEMARRHIEESLQIHRSNDHSPGMGRSEWALSVVLCAAERWEEAYAAATRSFSLQKGLGDKAGMVASLRVMGEVKAAREEWPEAIRLWSTAEAWRKKNRRGPHPIFLR